VQEKRKHPRKVIEIYASYRTASGEIVPALVRDLSLGGAYLETLSPGVFGERIVLMLKLPDLEKLATIEATVRWTKPEGMGVQFGLLGARETHGIVTLLST